MWLLGDHLGSASIAADADGSLLSRQGCLPWGELRYTEGSLPGRYQFTGQASYEAEFGLYYYKARWYDPHLGRWIQPDSIVPEATQGVQAWDRYAYVNNSPINYNDPSGHCFGGGLDTVICIVVAIVAVGTIAYDNSRRAEVSPGGTGCQGNLAECFESNEIKDFSSGQQINQDEFDEMLGAVFEDIDSKVRTPYDYSRTVYDTPFYTGNSTFDPDVRPDDLVCFGDQCYRQSAVNYVAQGMYSAASGQSLEDSQEMANNWNSYWYHHDATDDELYWLEYGYNYYLQQSQNEK